MLDRLRELQPQLPPAEARVAEVLLQQPQAFMRTPVAEIARRAGTSQPTVLRFCRTMGASGLQDFKLKLAAALQLGGGGGVHPAVAGDDPLPVLAHKVVEASVLALNSVGTSLDLGVVGSVVDRLATAKRADFVGIGQSALVAQDAKLKFFRFGLVCEAHADPSQQAMSASTLQAGDLLVVISASGRSPELFDAIALARAGGAAVVSIGAPGSPVDALADHVLHALPVDDPDTHLPMLGRLQHLLIVDLLAVALAQRLGEPGRERLARFKQVLAQRRRRGPPNPAPRDRARKSIA
jgi:RpiR family carbohydrate utilization transcriptional regulator